MHLIRHVASKSVGWALPLFLTACPTAEQGPTGERGAAGLSCSVQDRDDGTQTILCEDGTSAEVDDGRSCTVTESGDTTTVTCEDGTSATFSDGADGTSCTVIDDILGGATLLCEDGTSATIVSESVAQYVGWRQCEPCHQAIFDAHARSGHAWALQPVDGARPSDLASIDAGNGPDQSFADAPPGQWDWSDLSYVIGGWGWKNLFVDADGYVVTCDKSDNSAGPDGICCEGHGTWNVANEACEGGSATFENQYNLAGQPGTTDWVSFQRGRYHGVPFDCGGCHTTGWVADGDHASDGDLSDNQDSKPGVLGTFAELGVRCEACHGPGSRHAAAPHAVRLPIDRSAEACGTCHVRTPPTTIAADGTFLEHNQQWNEMFSSKKHVMDCIDCHDPHQSARYELGDNPSVGIQVKCESCHFREAALQKSQFMEGFDIDCVACHMPKASKSALSDPTRRNTADVASHVFAINPDATAQQLSLDGAVGQPYLTIDYACKNCHAPAGGSSALPKTDAVLEEYATGYHDCAGLTGSAAGDGLCP